LTSTLNYYSTLNFLINTIAFFCYYILCLPSSTYILLVSTTLILAIATSSSSRCHEPATSCTVLSIAGMSGTQNQQHQQEKKLLGRDQQSQEQGEHVHAAGEAIFGAAQAHLFPDTPTSKQATSCVRSFCSAKTTSPHDF
jgi:hypothetical protein